MLKHRHGFYYINEYRCLNYNATHSRLTQFWQSNRADYLLTACTLGGRIKQIYSLFHKKSQSDYGFSIDFLLFVRTVPPASQISTTIITLLRQVFFASRMMKGLRHLLCRPLPTGNEPVVLNLGQAISLCKTQRKIENEHVVVSVFMIEFAFFTFGLANTSESEYRLARQSSHFQPEDHSCYGH